MERRHLGGTGLVLLLIAGWFVVSLFFGATGASAAFSPSDLAGTWYMIEKADHPTQNGPFWSAATVTVDATGAITGGMFTNSMGDSGAITGGSLTIDAAGLVSGFGTATNGMEVGTITFPHGKLDATKTFLGLAVTEEQGDVGIMIGIKGGGTFATSDLAGTWYLIETADHPTQNGPFWSAATVTVDATGAITGGMFTNSMGDSGAITGGSLTIDAAGLVSGFGTATNGMEVGTITFPHGKLDATKTFLGLAVTEEQGDVGIMIGIKGGGTFATSDLAGTWYLIETADHPTQNGPFWSAATVTVDATGAITGGMFTNSMGDSGAITGGSLTIDAAGLVSGFGTATNGMEGGTITFPHGKLDATKTFLGLAVTEEQGDVGLMIGIKGDAVTSKVGTFRPSDGTFYLDYNGNGQWDGCGTDRCLQIGMNGDIPRVGDWNGSGTGKVGVFRPSDGTFYLDYNGNGVWDGCGVDRCLQIGMNGDTPPGGRLERQRDRQGRRLPPV